MTSLPTASELAAMSLAAQHPLARTWLDDTARLELLAEEHAFDLQLATDLELAGKRAEFLRVGQVPAAFLNRWVSISPDLDALLSIRFEGLDPEKPFVDASVTSRPVMAADLTVLSGAARDAYGAFQPGRLRFWSAAETGAFPGTRPDMRVLAAPLVELRGGEVPDVLTLSPTRDTSHHADAVAAYADVDAAHPGHAGQARVIDEDDLKETIGAGTMFDVLWLGEWSGYAGVLAKSKHGLPAYSIQEPGPWAGIRTLPDHAAGPRPARNSAGAARHHSRRESGGARGGSGGWTPRHRRLVLAAPFVTCT